MIECKFENGGKASLRHITVVAIVVNKEGKILLIKRAPHLLRGGKYTIPGGFLNRDEDTSEGVRREVAEETGISVEDLMLFRINDNPERPKEDRQNVDFVFIAKTKDSKIKADKEVAGFIWIDKLTLPPDEEFAFDHRDSILKYFKYLKESFQLPIIG